VSGPLELLLVAAAGLVAALPWLRDRASGQGRLGALLVVSVLGGYAARDLTPAPPRAGGEADPGNARRPRPSRDGGFVSSDACRACHPSEYASWHRSYHRSMTQVVTPETLLADWQGSVSVNGLDYRLEREGDQYWVDMVDPEYGAVEPSLGNASASEWRLLRGPNRTRRVRRRVLLSTGSHNQQVYWMAAGDDRKLYALPFTWLVAERRFIPYEDSFLAPEPEAEYTVVWNEQCIKCHATGGQPRLAPDGEHFDTAVGELGIGCEACHGPAERHVQANRPAWRRYLLYLTGDDDPTIVQPERLPAARAVEVCGQCHGVLGDASERLSAEWWRSGFGYRAGEELQATRRLVVRPAGPPVRDWLGDPEHAGRQFFDSFTWADGQIRTSGRDYNGLAASPCAGGGELTCLSCHSMHESEPDDQLAAQRDGDQACLQCHTRYAADLERHTHHAPASSGSRCYNCHNPYTTYGLFKAIRSHTFGRSPSVSEDLEVGRPNACNLCHLDRTLAWTQERLASWYGAAPVEIPPEHRERSAALLWLLRGDAGQRALLAWHAGWAPALEASGRDWIAPFLAELLVDDYAAVRFIAARSLKRLPGFEDLDADFVADPRERAERREEVLRRWRAQPGGEARDRALFLDAQGALDAAAVRGVLERRDARTVRIAE